MIRELSGKSILMRQPEAGHSAQTELSRISQTEAHIQQKHIATEAHSSARARPLVMRTPVHACVRTKSECTRARRTKAPGSRKQCKWPLAGWRAHPGLRVAEDFVRQGVRRELERLACAHARAHARESE